MRVKIWAYIELTKPGIVLGNLIAVTGGFLLGSGANVAWMKGSLVALGVSLVIASACAINNVVDRDIDAKMVRTQRRPTVRGVISARAAVVFATVTGVAGFALVSAGTGRALPTLLIAAGYMVYTGPYSLHLKRHSVHGTLAGSVAGAMPPVAGYCASAGRLDVACLVLFTTFTLWQLPHAYAIAIRREADYRAARIPVLPVEKGMLATKRQMLLTVGAFGLAADSLGYFGYAGAIYEVTAVLAGIVWFLLAVRGFSARDDVAWARTMFLSSVVVATALYGAMSIDGRRPTESGSELHRPSVPLRG